MRSGNRHKDFLRKLIFSAFILSFLLHGACISAKPNILFIAVDDLRPELNVYGVSQIKSPNIDEMALESVMFNRAYCNVPVCGASRASLLSGARPTRHRFLDYNTKKNIDLPDAISLPLVFKQNGYTTISNGKVYHHASDDSEALDEIWRPRGNGWILLENIAVTSQGQRGRPYESANVSDSAYFDGRTANKAIKDLRQLKNSNQPFFLAVGFVKPHLPFNAPVKYWEMYKRDEIALPDNYLQP